MKTKLQLLGGVLAVELGTILLAWGLDSGNQFRRLLAIMNGLYVLMAGMFLIVFRGVK